jgi:hypothetical protein
MFTGDLVTNPTPVIIMKEEDSIDEMDSLRVVVNLDFEKSYGGHGVWDKNRIKEILTNMLKLKEKVDVLWNMGLDVEQIVEKIFSNVPKKVLLMEEMSGGEWSRKNLVESILGMRHKPLSSLPPKSNVN